MCAAVMALQQQQPARIVVGVPISSPETCSKFQTEVDEIVGTMTPRPFLSVGLWYDNFEQTTDEEVKSLLSRSANSHPPSSIR